MLFRITFICVLSYAAACRPKEKATPLALVPEDAPAVLWLPEPRKSIEQVNSYLAVFERESLGEQLKALRQDWQKQTGVDPLDPASMEAIGLDLQKPWALVASAERRRPVLLLAAKDPERFVARFSQTLKESELLDAPRVQGAGSSRVLVYEQPFGNTTLEQYALRVIDGTVLVSQGDGGAEALAAWPSALDRPEGKRSFQKTWKKAESDGSMGGAALRLVAKDSAHLLPERLREALGNAGPQNPKSKVLSATEPELRCALDFKAHRAELFVALLGTAPDLGERLFAAEPARAAGLGLASEAVLVARSSLDAPRLYRAAASLEVLAPVVSAIEAQLGKGLVERLFALGTGAAALAVEMKPSAAKPAGGHAPWERLKAVLDAFPITATAELKDEAAFDRELVTLQSALSARHVPATLEKTTSGLTLKAATVGDAAVLSRDGPLLTYAVGPGAYAGLRERVQGKRGIDAKHPRFGLLFEPKLSGIVLDLSALVRGASALPELLLGEQSALATRFFGRVTKSFEHFDTAGVTLTLEGPAMGLHPVVRAWLSTK